MAKVKIGIVGTGNIATNAHMPAYRNCPDAEIAAVADIDAGRARVFAEKFGVEKVYSSVEEMLAGTELDGVDVCTWNRGHADVSIAALQAGKAVMCEKPLAASLEDALRIEEAVRQSGSFFMLAVPNRFNPPITLARELLDRGELGEIYYAKTSYLRRRGTPIGWFTDSRQSGGGPVLDIGVHRIDACWFLMGNPKPVRVSAAAANRLGEYETKGISRWQGTPCPENQNDVEDFGAGVIHFENGAIMAFEASWAINGPDFGHTQIYGTKAGLVTEPLTIYGERAQFLSDDVLTPDPSKSFDNEIAAFVDSIKNGTPSRVPIGQAIELQRMLQGIYDSARLGREVTL